MSTATPRLAQPYIQQNQAQKEVTHNAALNVLDALVQATAEDKDLSAPPPSPTEGAVWIVGASATGAWAGEDGKLAQFIGGGWSFHAPSQGFAVWLRDEGLPARFADGVWIVGEIAAAKLTVGGDQIVGGRQGAIPDASGGAIVDAEARAAINALLGACRAHGLIES